MTALNPIAGVSPSPSVDARRFIPVERPFFAPNALSQPDDLSSDQFGKGAGVFDHEHGVGQS